MRAALALLCLVVVVTSCAQSCSGVGGIDDNMRFGSMHGDMRPSVGADDGAAPVVGVQWTIQPAFEFAAYLDVDEGVADGATIETPACRGALCSTLAVTQATAGSRPTLDHTCPVGATSLPCWVFDGTSDYWRDSTARPELSFIHNGDGGACVVVAETNTTTGLRVMLDTANVTSNFVGAWHAQEANASGNGRSNSQIVRGVGGAPATPVAQIASHDNMQVNWLIFSHGSSRSPNYHVQSNAVAASTGTYVNAPSTSTSGYPLTIGRQAQTSGSFFSGYYHLVACWDVALTAAQIDVERGNAETYFGGTFPL